MNKPNITVSLTTNDLSLEIKEAMWDVYRPYYSYDKETFFSRFHKNNHYALYSNSHTGELVGFTGLRINEAKINGKKTLLIYFGQTIVSSACRGKSLIQKTGIQLIARYWRQILTGRAWFWADALSYKAYLVFAKSMKEYYPTYKCEMPEAAQYVVDFIGETHYGDNYCRETGTVKKTIKYVADPSVTIRSKDQEDPDVAFYAKANPRSDEGHGLITFTPISLSNIYYLFSREAKKALGFSKKKRSVATTKMVLQQS